MREARRAGLLGSEDWSDSEQSDSDELDLSSNPSDMGSEMVSQFGTGFTRTYGVDFTRRGDQLRGLDQLRSYLLLASSSSSSGRVELARRYRYRRLLRLALLVQARVHDELRTERLDDGAGALRAEHVRQVRAHPQR